MPNLEQNLEHWSAYDWSAGGEEWSEEWGGTAQLWWGTLMPRLHSQLPVETALEIGCGHGRFSSYLRRFSQRLVLVDFVAGCVDACRRRFVGDDDVECFENDGLSLGMVGNGEIDLAFSFDSLVHADAGVLEAYIGQLARKLAPGGVAFLHHSNLRAVIESAGDRPVENPHWRALSVSARWVRQCSEEQGLSCVSQELVNWGGEYLTDCFSVIARVAPGSVPLVIRQNAGFMDEARRQRSLARLQTPATALPRPATADEPSPTEPPIDRHVGA